MKIFTGVVISAKLPKTVTVRIERSLVHPLYGKRIKRKKNFLCHDGLGVKVGDVVSIRETRPMSARKTFAVIKIEEKGTL